MAKYRTFDLNECDSMVQSNIVEFVTALSQRKLSLYFWTSFDTSTTASLIRHLLGPCFNSAAYVEWLLAGSLRTLVRFSMIQCLLLRPNLIDSCAFVPPVALSRLSHLF